MDGYAKIVVFNDDESGRKALAKKRLKKKH
jgi:hypothetical protein